MQTVVGVLRGGPSREHDVSLRSGATILANLPEERYTARDIYIDKQGVWHDHGKPTPPEKILRQIDVALLGLHGEYGEDGGVQKLLERFGVPYAGADSYGSYLAMHKVMSKVRASEAGMLVPEFKYIENIESIDSGVNDVIRTFHQPVVVKPVSWGSSIGISIVGGYAPVFSAVHRLFADGADGVLIEEMVKGKEATVGVIEGMRGEKLYSLPTLEIVPPQGDFYSLDAKYSGKSKLVCPGNFSRVVKEELQRLAKVIHRALGLRHYSRSDFIVTPKGIYYLETNTLPGMTEQSDVPAALKSVGISLPEFLTHLVNLAMSR